MEIYCPSFIIVMISWVSFLIRPECAPARVALGITTILTMVTISRSARESLPKVPLTLFLLRVTMYPCSYSADL